MKKILLLSIIASLVFVSCIDVVEVNKKDILVKNIDSIEQKIFSDKEYTPIKSDIDTMILLYDNYIDKYKDDSLAIIYMFKKAGLLKINHQYEQAIAIFEDINMNHPKFNRAPDALLYEAMIYGDDLKNEVMAEKKYKEFISKYPNHPYRKDAEDLIKLLGKSDEEIMEMILKNDTIK